MEILFIIILSVICVGLLILYSNVRDKNKKLINTNTDHNNTIKRFNKKIDAISDPIRQGYYERNYTQGTYKYIGVIFVQEMDKYINGDSRIRLLNIELKSITNSKVNTYSATEFIKRNFSTIKKTSEITWLESKDEIKKIRKSKIAEIKKMIGE